jgi:uncharacterized protein with GYD domain
LAKYFILITVKAGTDARVMDWLEKIQIVKEVYEVYGAYDIVAIAEAASPEEVKKVQFDLEKFDYVWAVQVERVERKF